MICGKLLSLFMIRHHDDVYFHMISYVEFYSAEAIIT